MAWTRQELLEALYTETCGFMSERFGDGSDWPGENQSLDRMFALLWQLDQTGGIDFTALTVHKIIDVDGYLKDYYKDE